MSFRVFLILIRRSVMAEINATINKSVLLKTYNQSNIEQISRCTVKIRHSDIYVLNVDSL